MSHLSAAEAKRWHTLTRKTLSTLKQIYPLGAAISELPVKVLSQPTRFRILGALVKSGYLRRANKHQYVAEIEPVTRALESDELISSLIWPKQAQQTIGNLLQEPVLDQQQQLPAPPAIENIIKPPAGASPEVIQEWIFTLLHAQTENLIYIRERVDELRALRDDLQGLIKIATAIVESLK